MSILLRTRVPSPVVRSLVLSWDYITLKQLWFNIYTAHNIDRKLSIREKVDLIKEFTLLEIREHYRTLSTRCNNLLILYMLNSMANIAGMNVPRISLRSVNIPELTDSDIARSSLLTNTHKEALDKELIHNLLQFEFDELLYEFMLLHPQYTYYIQHIIQDRNMPKSHTLCRVNIENE